MLEQVLKTVRLLYPQTKRALKYVLLDLSLKQLAAMLKQVPKTVRFLFPQTKRTEATDLTGNGYWTHARLRKDPENPDRETTETIDATDLRTMHRHLRRRLQLPVLDRC